MKPLRVLTTPVIEIIGNKVLMFTYEDEHSYLSIIDEEISRLFIILFSSLLKIAKK